uniref:Uncharacterized protein n=1 Tax=Anopheles melas TaxID=34690 RepID=A0A182U5E6_9DIPT
MVTFMAGPWHCTVDPANTFDSSFMAALVTACPTCWLICCLVLAGSICAMPATEPPPGRLDRCVALRGPPGLGGDSRGLSRPLDNQSFFTGGGTGVEKVAIDTSPKMGNDNKHQMAE